MLRLQQNVLITQVPTDKEPDRNKVLYFPAINEVVINETFDDLTNTAQVTLPRNLKFEDRNIYEGDNPLIRRGDKIKLSAGYAPNMEIRFEGYISKIDNNLPLAQFTSTSNGKKPCVDIYRSVDEQDNIDCVLD